MLRVAVVGTGAFGRNHLRVYRELESAGAGVALAAPSSLTPRALPKRAPSIGIPVFDSVEKLLGADLELDAVSVAVPTVHHHAVAAATARRRT